MQVAVWDTYVTRKNGVEMHFDILVPDTMADRETIYGFGREYLKTKEEEGSTLANRECSFCHIEQATPEMEQGIAIRGYYIIEMEGCE